MTDTSSIDRPSPSGSSESSGSLSFSSSRESPAALACATTISLSCIGVLAYAWLATDRFVSAPWWAGPAAVAIAALPTSVRAAAVKSLVARISPRK